MASLLVSYGMQVLIVASALGRRGLAEEDVKWHREDCMSDNMDDGISLLALAQRRTRSSSRAESNPSDSSTCVPLANKGSHFTMDMEVGTPLQGSFSVIVDTGSNSLIVQSCVCGQTGGCVVKEGGKCFQGSNKSSTFEYYSSSDGWVKPDPEKKPPDAVVAQIAFGSGKIQGVIVKDVVRVGGLQVTMEDGFLSMIHAQLNIAGPTLEGILGLGLPASTSKNLSSVHSKDLPANMPKVTSFLEQANIQRFAMCFNEGSSGVLRLGTPEPTQANTLGSYGRVHWGLGVDGISVVGASGAIAPMAFELCVADKMKEGQETPCGAIPDSGTTSITGSKAHFVVIKAAICDAWPRCTSFADHAKVVGDVPWLNKQEEHVLVKAGAFDKLIKDCNSWLHNGTGAAELPTLRFNVTGKNGRAQDIEFPGNSYFFEMQTDEVKVEYAYSPIFGHVPLREERTGKKVTVCQPAFMEMEYNTALNGPVFILGLPLFYEYKVDYNLGAIPPELAFTSLGDGGCETCDKSQPPQLAQIGTGRQWPRRVKGPLREPTIDVSQPL